MLPAISLVITAYNRERYLGAAIESILTQTRGDFELLIWDDGSTDSSVEIARKYEKLDHRVKVIVGEHSGQGSALKSAIAKTTAPYIGWVDSDDLLAPTALKETAAILDRKADIGWVYTDYLDINENDTILSYGYRCLVPYSREELLNKFMTFHFRLIRREVFELAGGIDESLEVEDYDLCMRLSEVAKVQHIFKPLYYYRTHPNTKSWQRQYQQIRDSYKAVVKAQKRRKSWRNSVAAASIIPVLLGLFPNFAQAQSITPANDGTGTVVNNQGNNINISGGSLSSDHANLFHSFSQFGLDANQTANFLSQPQIQNILGRVTGGNASVINGLIQLTGSNANLYLINPAGIIFGGNSSLNVPAAFTATTANGIGFANNQWFNAIGTNNYSNLIGNPTGFGFTTNQPGSIFNAGNLAVGEGSSLTLLGGTVINTGTLTAPGGNIKIIAVPGNKVVRITPENSLLSVDLPIETQTQINPQIFSPLSLPQLLTGGNLPTATGFTVENGEIKLTSTNTVIPTNPSTTIVSGQVSVANSGNTNNTPQIQILGDRIALFNANINASSINGGTVLIGGDYQGQGTVPKAISTFVSGDSIIAADGLQNGGKVIVWADDTTRFFGKISAKSVNGGFVETSGKNFLDVTDAKVDASGSNGQAGTWLLDPTDVEIVNSGTGTLTSGIFDPATSSNIAPSTIVSALDGGTNVTITTASGTGGSGDITLTDLINQTGGGSASLTLTGRRFLRNSYGSIINMNSAGALTFNINQVAPETTAPNSSIQNAINAIGTVAGNTIINLGAGTYTGSTIVINKPLTINGVGAVNTILDAQNNNRVFEISSSGTITFSNFAIVNGNGNTIGNYGGAIYDKVGSNTLNLSNITFNNNLATLYGGAIYNEGSAINISNSIFSGNTASSGGGAIYNSFGTVTINNSTFSSNSATSDGGAIYNQGGDGGTVNTSNSTFSSNTASNGGAIYNNGAFFDDIVIVNTTFSGNSATSGSGGAIYNLAGGVTITNGTLSNNSASVDGGGIYNSSDGGILLQNTIVAGNIGSTNPDISDTFARLDTTSSYNLIGNGTGVTVISNGSNGNQIGTAAAPIDPKLAVLGDYGGVTQTMALLLDSPAINAGSTVIGVTTDQRGVSRPQGAVLDIGAFESVGYTLTPIAGSGQSTTVNTNFATNLQAQVTENGFNKAVPGANVTFNAPSSGASASFTGTNTLTTNSSGIVAIPVKANTITGNYNISANSGVLTPATFSLTNNPDVPVTIIATGGTPQATIVTSAFANQLEATVKDQYGNVVPNATVTFNAPISGASASFTGTNTLTTNSSGIVKIPVTANTITGNYNISANSGVLTPAQFTLINQPNNSSNPPEVGKPPLIPPIINFSPENDPVAQIDQKFTNEFKQYLSIASNTETTSVNESQGILTKISDATGIQPALIYVSFVPTTIANSASSIIKSDSDRLELVIVTSKGKPTRKVINVTRSQVIGVAKNFKNAVTDTTLRSNYKKPGKEIYDWIIAPIESELQKQKIDNLVFILDGGLRSLPIAAIYDGEKYLVESYSVGLMPSLSLSDTKYVDIRKAEVLGMGASKFTNQNPLPAVPTELSTITTQLWQGKSFLNESFTLKNLKNQRRETPYGIIHLATHGEFKSGEPSNSYIQLWDDQLKMDQLRQLGWNNPPVELLVLSACRTAIGDEQAELGFAGFAVQAGAKSALASLWYVSDEGTLGLMTEFYKQLKTSPIKAEALRQAQIAMLKGEVRIENGKLHVPLNDYNLPPLLKKIGNKELQHPYFWSAFTMIGNPW